MKNRLSFLIATLFVSMVSVAKVSEKFSITTAEGVTINFAVTNEEEKTCEVYGTSDCPAIDRTLDGDITIPGEANGYKVTSIGDKAFYQCANLVSVTIPEGVVSIGEAAFYGCTNIKTIHIPSSVQRIKGYAFFNCENLMSATLPEGIKEISSCLFEGCFSLSSVSIPSTVTTIEDYAFLECKQLADVVIPEGVTDIGAMAFYGCEGLTSINMPHSLVRIALSAFRNCIQLTEVSFPAYCQLSEIGPSVFSGCTHLKTINLPLRLKSLGNGTFNNCINLQSIVLPEGIPSIESNTFEGCERLESVQIPASVESIGFYAFGSCSTLTSVTFAEGSQLNSIGDNAFTNCVHLSSLQLPESVHSIGYKAFGGCQNLRTIYMPQGVSLIGGEAFWDCHSLESVVLPTHLQAIQWNTFAYCRSLTSVIIPEGVSRIERFSFGGCEKLTEVELPSTLTEIGDNAFGDCPSLNRVISHIQKPFDIARNVFEWYGAQVGKNFFTTATLYIPHGTRPLYEILDTWSLFPEIIEEQEYNGYRPFIEDNKTWHLHGAHFGGQSWMTDYVFTEEKRTEANGKTYQVMYKKEEGDTTEVALLREEDGRVYTYNPDAGTEQLIYDFTLKEGDTFQLDIPQLGQTTCDVLHVGQIVQQGEVLKTITYGYPVYYGEGIEAEVMEHTWIEGIGSKGTPLSYYPNTTPNSMRGYLAYVSSEEHFYPFSFNDTWTGWRGQGLQRGEDLSYQVSEEQWGHDDLHYEILPGQPWGDDKDTLHVYGNMWIACGGDSYIYCRENTATHELSLELEYATLATPCLGYFVVDIRFPFFSATSGVKYMVTDAEGTHAVELRKEESTPYRPFIEDGKVWTVKSSMSGMETVMCYYYFDGNTVVDGKTCKRMMCRAETEEQWTFVDGTRQKTTYVGAFYEEGQRVFCTLPNMQTPVLLYDFGAAVGETINVYATSLSETFPFVVESKNTEESDTYKGISTQVRPLENKKIGYVMTDTWYAGVGGRKSPDDNALYYLMDGNYGRLMVCTVGDEVLYKHPDWTIDESEALGKKRVDFTHVIKTKPKSPQQRTEKVGNGMISGEYSNNVLMIDLGMLHEAYEVTITASSGKAVYTKDVKTSNVVALNIDISEYTGDDYTITVENNREIFTGLFNLSRPNAIEEIPCAHPVADDTLHDLTGRPVTGHPQRGVYIRNGKKVLIR